MAPVVTCHNLRKLYGATVAVDSLDLAVEPGEVFGLLGPDGAGKTTTMRMLCGILPPSAGTAEILGHDVVRRPEAVKAVIGYMSQRFSLYGDLTVQENIGFTADLYQVPLAEREARARQLLAASRLEPFRGRLAQDLSGGMKQKLALVCTLIHTPPVLLLDEPTTGVDPVSRRDFWQILYGLVGEGMTLVVSTPYMDEAERCHRVALMHRGRLLLTGTPEDLRREMRGAVAEVRSERPQQVRSAIEGVPGVGGVEAFGDRLHVLLDDAGAEPRLRAALQASGHADADVRLVPPTLEDVFVSAVR